MKNVTAKMMALALVVSLNGAFASENKTENQAVDLRRAEQNYMSGLRSKLVGVQESSMLYVLQLKKQFPEKRFNVIERELMEIAQKGATEELRYRAFVVLNYFQNPSWLNDLDNFKIVNAETYNEDIKAFEALAADLMKRMIVNETRLVSQQ